MATGDSRECTGAAVLFLPLFVFLPKLIQGAIRADTDAAIDAFGKNELVKKVFWTFFISMAGLVLARVVDPAPAQQIIELITGMGGMRNTPSSSCLFLIDSNRQEKFFFLVFSPAIP